MYKLYGSKISYFTGKLEAYLRYRELPFEFVTLRDRALQKQLKRETGTTQIPALQLNDGRWLTDTTPIINYLEHATDGRVIPNNPELAFYCRLLEDYADEWLWRPAMHFRWSYQADNHLLRAKIVDELLSQIPLPRWLKRRLIAYRQHTYFVKQDGVTTDTWNHVEQSYHTPLMWMQQQLQHGPFLLGKQPSLADFGMAGPMFRHFGSDPTPVEIMRERAPAVYAWLARIWNAKQSNYSDGLYEQLPQSWDRILQEIGQTHLENLHANALAWGQQNKFYDVCVQNTQYQKLLTSQYRVWCLQELRRHFNELPEPSKKAVQQRLQNNQCWEPLWRLADCQSNYDTQQQAPFNKGIKVYTFKATSY